jgi:hypothetical protein
MILIAVVMESPIFCYTTPCSPLKVNQRFGGTWCLHLQDQPDTRRYIPEHRTILLYVAYSVIESENELLNYV